MRRLLACLLGVLAILGPMAARGQTGIPRPYKLSDTSRFETGCFTLCDCPVLSQPLQGTFLLQLVSPGPLFDDYRISDIRWTLPDAAPNVAITGSGTYRLGGEVAVQHQMTLDLSVGGGPIQHFDSGLVGTTNDKFPRIEIRVPLHGDSACVDTVLVVHAAPATPTATGVESSSAEHVLALRAAHATPFRDRAELVLHAARPGDVTIAILDIHGRLVRQWTLEGVTPGDHPLVWDGRSGSGEEAATGVYLVRARQQDRVAVARVLRIR
jgi:hypothetical protein